MIVLATLRTGAGQDAAPPTSQPGAGPRFEAVDPVHDFGKVIEGQKLQHTFTYRNAGTMPLEIKRVAPACGCMTASGFTQSVAPGETGTVSVTLDTTKLLGPFMKTVNLLTNDPGNEVYVYTLRGDGRRMVEVSPTIASFGRIIDERTRETIVTVSNRSEKPMSISIADLKNAGKFEFELVETSPGFEYKIIVVLRPPYKEGALNGMAVLKTDVPGQESIQVNASAVVLPRLELLPNTLYYGDSRGAIPNPPSADRIVEFFNHGAKPIRLRSAKADDPAIEVLLKEVEAGYLYRVQIRTPAGYRPPNQGRLVTLSTDDSERATIELPIRLVGATVASGPLVPPPTTTKPAATTQKAAVERKPVMDLVGKAAPDISLTTGAGIPVTNAEFKRFPATVLNFVAPNCPYCKKQIPLIEKVRADYEDKGVRFINVGETLHGKPFTLPETMAVMDQLGARLELAMDAGNSYGVKYKITSFPALVVVGKDGVVADALPGARTDNADKLRTTLDKLIALEVGTKPGP